MTFGTSLMVRHISNWSADPSLLLEAGILPYVQLMPGLIAITVGRSLL
ncbi:MAG: hypothetical protein K0R08_1460 [Solimicrobium sp.]|nr:hypothetical protein [Solimicrobium sp.]